MKILALHSYLFFLGGSFLLSLCVTPLVRKIALARGHVAVPKDTRWHKRETALLGGVAIFFSSVAVWLAGAGVMEKSLLHWPYLPMILCAVGMFALGLTDDLINMDPQHKLAAQIVIASILMIFGFRLDWTVSRTANLFISIIWIVGVTNAFNLLDNMDGLSTGVAAIASIFIFLSHYLNPGPGTGPILF
jgi:UDP-GlcNAc:undecaprenyl-phosphate GlcNAc-1-phosphate transferase